MQIMLSKKLVRRDERDRSHVYRAAQLQELTHRQLLADLLDRAFGGSREKFLLSALQATRTSPKELDAIRQMIETAQSQSLKQVHEGNSK